MPILTELAESLPATVPFVGPETQERANGAAFKARLGANESVFGPSPRAAAAMAQAALDCWQYGDPENHDLKHALAAFHDVEPENIVVGEGIDSLLGVLVRLIVDKDTPVVTSLGAYPTFNFHVAGFGGALKTVPYRDDAEDPVAIAEAVAAHNAPLAYFANPDNPMGSWHDAATIARLIDAMPEQSLLCLDEAYCDFAPEGTLPLLDVSEKRVIRMRTFSKAYGMAGARVGYAIGHRDPINAFNKVRNHFGVNRIAQAGALAALADQEWLNHVIGEVHQANAAIAEIARANGLTPLETATNFVTIDCGHDGDFAKALVGELGKRGVFLRMPFVAPQNRCIRISSGTDDDLAVLADALPEALTACVSG
ncbi:MAG: pyridoxal phosphate-dependent aminotransferase [Pseudomonadota bacterium]